MRRALGRREPAAVHQVGARSRRRSARQGSTRSCCTPGSTTTRSCRRSSSASSGSRSRATGSTARPPTRRRCGRRPRGGRGRAAGLGARLRRHELDARRRRAAARRRAGRARRGRAAELRPVDAGGAQPDRGRRAVGAAALPGRALARDSSSAEGVDGRIEVVGDVMADASRLLRAARARALDVARAARRRARRLRRRDGPPRGERRDQTRLAPDRRRAEPARGAARLPRAPAHARRCARRGSSSRRTSGSMRAARLPRLRGARVAGARDRDRLGRPAEGGVLVRRARA